MTVSQPFPVVASPQAKPIRMSDCDLDLMLLIRHFEWCVLEMFAAGLVAGTTHTCLGQEHVPVALSQLLGSEDVIFSNHRGHGHYLARYPEPAGLLAEMTGREGGICGGMGGSQHIYRPGFLASGVQGQSLPVAVGVGLDLRRAGASPIVVAYIGDGTWGQGVVYEALNLAALWQVPLLLVVENNGIAQSTPIRQHLAGSIAGRARGVGIEHLLIDETDPETIRLRLREPTRAMRASPMPLIAEFLVDRVGPHSKGDDTRDPELLEQLQSRDWYSRYARAFPDQFSPADQRQRELIAATARDVAARPLVAGRSE